MLLSPTLVLLLQYRRLFSLVLLPPWRKAMQKFEAMISSERGDCSPSTDLLIEDDVPVIPPIKPVRERRATPLFPKPVSIIAGKIRGPTRAARAPADMLSEQLQSKEIHKLFNKQNPKPPRAPSTTGVSSS
jgi:hypothetical protein